MKTFYITTPIYYVNDRPHIGHAYTTIAADVLARWKRMKGEKIFFLTGTDEHGSKIAQAAEKAGCSPQEYADRVVAEFQSLWQLLNISNDDFIRTTQPRHIRTVQEVFKKLYDKSEIVKGFYEDWYCVACESFWLESELVNRNCPDCGRPVEKLKEESYFFKLSNYTGKMLDHYKKNPKFLSPPSRAQEIVNFVADGLKDLSVSRLKEKWGIPVPMDERHTVYVWFDALLNYLTAAGYGSDDARFKELWPADIHFVGKEIFRFHSAIWPAMLMALDLPLPKMVFAHGWWTSEGEKMSKSKGNIVDPREVVKEYGVDPFRYFVLREIAFGADGDFSKNSLKTRYNAELANNLGNLFSRTITLIEKYFGGTLKYQPQGSFMPQIESARDKIIQSFDKAAFHEALDALMNVITEANRYLDQKAPWNLAKTDLVETEKVLSECLIVLRWLAQGFSPFMPEMTAKMRAQIGEENPEHPDWKIFEEPLKTFVAGWKVQREGVLFPRKS